MNSQECIQLERLFFDLLQASLKPLSLFQKKQFWKQMGVNEKFMLAMPRGWKWAVLNDLCYVPQCAIKRMHMKPSYSEVQRFAYNLLGITSQDNNIHSINGTGMEFWMWTIKWLRSWELVEAGINQYLMIQSRKKYRKELLPRNSFQKSIGKLWGKKNNNKITGNMFGKDPRKSSSRLRYLNSKKC